MKRFLLIATVALWSTLAAAAPYAVLDGSNTVTNVIEGDGSAGFLAAFPSAVPLATPGAIGSTYNVSTHAFSAPPAPAAPTEEWVSNEQFVLRFTQAERLAVEASADAGVQDFLLILKSSPQVNVYDPVTSQGVNYLASKGLITSARATQILQ